MPSRVSVSARCEAVGLVHAALRHQPRGHVSVQPRCANRRRGTEHPGELCDRRARAGSRAWRAPVDRRGLADHPVDSRRADLRRSQPESARSASWRSGSRSVATACASTSTSTTCSTAAGRTRSARPTRRRHQPLAAADERAAEPILQVRRADIVLGPGGGRGTIMSPTPVRARSCRVWLVFADSVRLAPAPVLAQASHRAPPTRPDSAGRPRAAAARGRRHRRWRTTRGDGVERRAGALRAGLAICTSTSGSTPRDRSMRRCASTRPGAGPRRAECRLCRAERDADARRMLALAQDAAAALPAHDRRHIEVRALQMRAEEAPADAARLASYRRALDAAIAEFPADVEFLLLRGMAESPDPADRGQGSGAGAAPYLRACARPRTGAPRRAPLPRARVRECGTAPRSPDPCRRAGRAGAGRPARAPHARPQPAPSRPHHRSDRRVRDGRPSAPRIRGTGKDRRRSTTGISRTTSGCWQPRSSTSAR